MWNNKRFLNGLGIGIVIGAVLLQLVSIGQSPDSVLAGDQPEVDKTEQSLKSQQQDADPSQQQKSRQELQQQEQQQEQQPKQSQSGNDLDSVRNAAEQLGYLMHDAKQKWYSENDVESIKNEMKKQFEEEMSADHSGNQKWGFTIAPKTNVSIVAAMLVELGLITDRKSFEAGMKGKNIRDGYYYYLRKPDAQMLIRDITSSR